MVIKLGIIGLSEGNGHPFSFAAIINGYEESRFKQSGWDVINDYLKIASNSSLGLDGVKVTHAWTQDRELTELLCRSCDIEFPVNDFVDMIASVDGVVIARDDWESHMELARPFLEAGKYVFIDKPLSLDEAQVDYFRGFIEDGRLMSCSGLRYAKELEVVKGVDFGEVRAIQGAVVGNWTKYGIHILDAVFAIIPSRPIAISRNPVEHDSVSIRMADGSCLTVDAIGAACKTFTLSIYGTKARATVEMSDNYSAFRNTLEYFITMIRTGTPPIEPETTVIAMRTLSAGMRAMKGKGYENI